MIDLEKGKVFDDEKVKRSVYEGKPYYQWIIERRIKLRLEPIPGNFDESFQFETLLQRQQAYGYTREDIKTILKPMAEKGYEPIGSMGDDTPLAVLSKESRHISNYFKQHFAQVSNRNDPIRERLACRCSRALKPVLLAGRKCRTHSTNHISQPVLLSLIWPLKIVNRGYDYTVINCV